MYIRARGANSFTGGKRKTAAARRADKSRDKLHVFVGHESLDGTLPKGSPRCRQLARVFRAHTHTLHRKKDDNRAAGARRGEQKHKKLRTRHERSDTHRHFVAGGALCRRGVYERREKKESGRRVGAQKNPSQHEVVRDGRRVTDGIRTHDIQNHNLTL